MATTNFIHIQEFRARKAVCTECPLNSGSKCLGNNTSFRHNLLAGFCSRDLWPKDFRPSPYQHRSPEPIDPPPSKKQPPALSKQVRNFSSSMRTWAKDKFRTVGRSEHERRLEICKQCPSLDPSGWGGTGKCLECGCSVVAKSKIRLQQCPLGKW